MKNQLNFDLQVNVRTQVAGIVKFYKLLQRFIIFLAGKKIHTHALPEKVTDNVYKYIRIYD